MPQVLKEEVREQILKAALEVFSEQGFLKTRMNDIALKAEVSTGNLYRYYQSKEEIFNHVISPEFPKQFLSFFRKRVKALEALPDWTTADAYNDKSAEALLDFMINNRELSLILLKGSEGTPYSEVREALVNELTETATKFVKDQRKKKNPIMSAFIVKEIFANTISTMTNTLQSHDDPTIIKETFNSFWRYHLAGLKALLQH